VNAPSALDLIDAALGNDVLEPHGGYFRPSSDRQEAFATCIRPTVLAMRKLAVLENAGELITCQAPSHEAAFQDLNHRWIISLSNRIVEAVITGKYDEYELVMDFLPGASRLGLHRIMLSLDADRNGIVYPSTEAKLLLLLKRPTVGSNDSGWRLISLYPNGASASSRLEVSFNPHLLLRQALGQNFEQRTYQLMENGTPGLGLALDFPDSEQYLARRLPHLPVYIEALAQSLAPATA
jgi:hypothetical protein